MSDTLFSPSWYRVADLKPRLRGHLEIQRHDYRGRVSYILQDHVGGRSHRIKPEAYRFIGIMDGTRSVNELWQTLQTQEGDTAPTQDEVIRLLGQLHAADALLCDRTPDSLEVFRRFQRAQRMRLKQKLWTPLAVRFPLLDPEKFLERTYPYIAPLFGRFGAVLWLLVVGTGIVLAAVHWSELTENIADRALTPANLLWLWLVYPVVKALHELGHGYAIKKGGGEVHEIGIMFLVLIPVPYVDASSAWGFRDKYQRMLVGAAGIAVELFLGSLALFVWLNSEPGAARTITWNVMLISGVSTLLFNGNPLLRFDGYYVLMDALEIPNLGTRANKYLGYLLQRYAFGVRDADDPADSTGERVWFVIYGLAAFVYRMFIMFAIILYIGSRFFAVGVILALWAIVTMMIVPVTKHTNFLVSSPRLRHNRGRSVGVSMLLLTAILAILFILPAPLWTRVQGVTWPPESSQVRAGAEGFIVRLSARPGSQVQSGQALIEMQDPFIESRVKVLEADRQELESQLLAAQAADRVQAAIIREALAAVDGALKLAREQTEELIIRSPRQGKFVVPQAQDLPERFVRKGQILGYVLNESDPVILRAIVSQDQIALVRERSRRVSVMPADWRATRYPAAIRREVPGGTSQLPTAALGTVAGGNVTVDPRDPDGRTTLQRVFEFEIALPDDMPARFLGDRMYVRFDHGYEPVGLQLYRALRQLLLRRFGV